MKRKVNLVGQNTLTVSLPTKWVKDNNIQKGDEIELEEDGKEIRISTHISTTSKKTKIHLLQGNTWYIDQMIRIFYTSGYDELTVEFDESSLMVKIQEAVGKLWGFEIIEQGKTYCMIKAVSIPLEDSLEVLMKRFYLQTVSLFDMILEGLSKHDFNHLNEFTQIYQSTYKINAFCKRILNKNKPYTTQKNDSVYTIIKRMGDISANTLYIYRYLSKKTNLKIQKETIDYIKDTKDHFKLFYETMFASKIDNIEKINKNREILITEKMTALLEKNKGPDSVVIYYCAEIVRGVAAVGGALLVVCIENKSTH